MSYSVLNHILLAILFYSIMFSILSILSRKILTFVNIFLHQIVNFNLLKTYMAHSPVMCEIEISNCRKINLIIAYCFIFVLREEHLENAFA